ncbi:MAG TPA: hypothetical protein VHC48_16510 [Puia sp.]|nr:hypothetical protein [Puia sp.]
MIRFAAVVGCWLVYLSCFGQVTDSTRKVDSTHKGSRLMNNNIFQFFRNALSRGGGADTNIKPIITGQVDSSQLVSALNTKSESPFMAYEGKVIRHIIVKTYGFEQTFTDTSKRLQYFGTKLLNQAHRKTRDWVIRNSLFIKENTALNPFKVADNERLIRSLNFIQDARILVNYLPDAEDSVDLVVVVKDLFSIGGELASLAPNSIHGNISEANFLGMGQKIQGGIIAEQTRHPGFGYQLLYTKTNVYRFVNAAASYTEINNNLKDGTPDEQAWFLRLERPLYAPYAHLAGGINLGTFQSINRYRRPDSLFFNYRYWTHDFWLGWNLGSDRFLSNTSVRDRKFVSLRYFKNHFTDVPYQIADQFNFRFNDREAALAQFTFFRQDFYKTNYIYGFGTTEDVPAGYNVALTTGYYRQTGVTDLRRFYSGVDANSYVVTKRGGFVQYFFRAGGFLRHGHVEDAGGVIGAGYYSPLFLFNNLKIRQYINFSFTKQFNRVGMDALTLNNPFGLRYFSGDSVIGSQRLTLHSETSFFLNFRLLGFKFAPFAFGDISLLTPEDRSFDRSSLYHGIGAGLRTRNENLVFNTIEFRMVYFPRKTEQNQSFKIMIDTGIQFRYSSIYVKAPDVVFLNNSGLNSIY